MMAYNEALECTGWENVKLGNTWKNINKNEEYDEEDGFHKKKNTME